MKSGSNFFRHLHHLPPLEIAEDGDDHIKAIKTGLEGNVLVKIQRTGDDVNDNSDEPLFKILACQSPNAHDA